MGLRDFARSLMPGNDHQLAAEQYAGQESASAEAARKRRESHRTNGTRRAAAQGEQWEQKDRRRFGGRA